MELDKIHLNRDNRTKLFTVFSIGFIALSVSLLYATTFILKNYYLSVGLGLGLAVLFFVIRGKLNRIIATGYLKDEYVVVKLLSDKSFILDKKYIKKVTSISLLFFNVTKISFKFDGEKYRIAIFSSNQYNQPIKRLLKMMKSQKKASHKPGSVNLGVEH